MHQYPPQFVGGTELYTQTIAKHQAVTDNSVSVFCPYPRGNEEFPEVIVEHGVRIYRIPVESRSRTQVFINSFRQSQLIEALEETVEKEKPDIVHIQHLMGLPMDIADRLMTADIPFVVTLHDYWYVCANAQLLTNTEQKICSGPNAVCSNCAACAFVRAGWPLGKWLAPAAGPLFLHRNNRLHKILEQAQAIIAPTNFVHHTYSTLGVPADKMTTILHGLELPRDRIDQALTMRSERARGERLHIGYVGGISWQKGIHVLIDAVNQLPEEGAQLTIFGSLSSFPEYVTELRQRIKHPGIRLAGPVSREQLWMALADFDVLVLPTLWYETSSLILDEAFAVKVPVIASRIGVMLEKIEEGKTGRLFPVGDAAALHKLLLDLINKPDTLEYWQEGIPSVRTIQEHVREIEEVYHQAIDAV